MELINIRIWVLNGIIMLLSTSSNRNLDLFFSFLIINESKLIFLKSEYSYLQYHWCPIDLIVKIGLKISSVRYKIFSEGIAIKIKIIIGKIVQIISILWFCKIYLLLLLFIIKVKIIYIIIIVIINKINIE